MESETITVEQAAQEATSWIDSVVDYLPQITFALLAVVVAVFIARLVRSWINKALASRISNKTVLQLIVSLSAVTIIILGVIIALNILNLNDAVTSLLAGAGIIGLALGFAFQDVAANFISGVIIATQKQFRVGDLIETQGVFGTVKKIELRMTAVRSLTGQIVYIPNKDILLNVLTDYSQLGRRRVDLTVGVSYSTDLNQAEQLALEAVAAVDGALEDPTPTLYYNEFADSSINFDVRFWISSRNSQASYLEARSDAIKNIKQVFADHDINIPFPITTVQMQDK
jgi:small conductance mechanosensitive channel